MGLAKLKVSNTTVTKMDVTGTPYYSAPETYYGKVGMASDIWSFVIVMIELFGGRHAWGVLKHHNELVANIMSKVVPSMGHLDPSAKQLYTSCLSYDPKERKPILEIINLLRNMS